MERSRFSLPQFYRRYKPWLQTWGIPLALFLLALLVRGPTLGEFLTVDEPRWLDRSRWFLTGLLFPNQECPPVDYGRDFGTRGFACTFQIAYPGVTAMWGGALGLLLHYWQTAQPTGLDLATYLQNLSFETDPGVIAPVRLPLAIFSALFIPVFYLLARRLLNEPIAILAALLLALHPFHVALSRVLHHDALNTTFMTLSIFAILGYWLKDWRWYWLPISAVMGGLAFLTKPVSWFLLPFIPTLALFVFYYRWQRQKKVGWKKLGGRLGVDGAIWGLGAVLTIFLFFPAMWVIPGEIIRSVFDTSTGLAEAGHPHYFLGEITRHTGPLFYPLGWLLRASPLEVLGLVAASAFLTYEIGLRSKRSMHEHVLNHPIEVALLLYLLTFFAFETVTPKKLVRYFLPAFPVIEIFVAFGLLWLASKLLQLRPRYLSSSRSVFFLSAVILLLHGWFLWNSFPYYFTYFNPLLGGAPNAAKIMDVGWGEGLNEAAAFLNQLPEAETLKVTTCRANALFEPFFVGKNLVDCSSLKEIMQTDYVVYYILHISNKDLIHWPYFRDHYAPVHRVNLDGLDYALVYRNPIENHISVDNMLRLGAVDYGTVHGYSLTNDGLLKLYWHNARITEQELVVGLAPIDNAEPYWVTCYAAPGFADEPYKPETLVESLCPLGDVSVPSGLYDIHLAILENNTIFPIRTSGIAFVSIGPDGHTEPVDRAFVLETGAKQAVSKDIIPLDITFGDRLRLVGYKLEATPWHSSQTGEVVLYWQPIRRPDFGLAQAYQLTFSLSTDGKTTPPLTAYPVLPESLAERNIARGSVIPAQYAVPLPDLASDSYTLNICLTTTGDGQVLENNEFSGCLPVPVRIEDS